MIDENNTSTKSRKPKIKRLDFSHKDQFLSLFKVAIGSTNRPILGMVYLKRRYEEESLWIKQGRGEAKKKTGESWVELH